MSALMVVFLVV